MSENDKKEKRPLWRQHHDRAHHERHQGDNASGIVFAVLALVVTQAQLVREVRAIRKLMQHTPPGGPVARLGLTATLVPKSTQGGGMNIGTFRPTETDDVKFVLNPTDVVGNPVAIPAVQWAPLSDQTAGELRLTADGALLVTAAGNISTDVSVQIADGSLPPDTATVTRGGGGGGGAVANLGLTATVVPKAGAASRRH